MKKVVMLVILYSVLLLCSIACESKTKVKTIYKAEENTIERRYEQFHEYILNDNAKGFFYFEYVKSYDFNYRILDERCYPEGNFCIIVKDEGNILKSLNSELLITDLKTSQVIKVPCNIKSTLENKTAIYMIECKTNQVPRLTRYFIEGKPFRLGFSYPTPTKHGFEEYMVFNFAEEELKQFESVMFYDIYKEPSQKSNIAKAMAARKTK